MAASTIEEINPAMATDPSEVDDADLGRDEQKQRFELRSFRTLLLMRDSQAASFASPLTSTVEAGSRAVANFLTVRQSTWLEGLPFRWGVRAPGRGRIRLRMCGFPVAQEQFLDAAGRVRVDSRQDVTQAGEPIDPAELATGRQAVGHRRPRRTAVPSTSRKSPEKVDGADSTAPGTNPTVATAQEAAPKTGHTRSVLVVVCLLPSINPFPLHGSIIPLRQQPNRCPSPDGYVHR